MRGKKSYNIRNIEAHLSRPLVSTNDNINNSEQLSTTPLYYLGNKMNYQYYGNTPSAIDNQLTNEIHHVRVQYGVSKYTANLVSGRMFKKL
jgi:hypothetical protein